MFHSQYKNIALKWSSTRKLTRTATGFIGTAKVPWNEKILYKYIVDGNWALHYGTPVEVESRTGFVNHVYIAPSKPQPVSKPEPVIAEPAGVIVQPEDVDRDHVCRPDQYFFTSVHHLNFSYSHSPHLLRLEPLSLPLLLQKSQRINPLSLFPLSQWMRTPQLESPFMWTSVMLQLRMPNRTAGPLPLLTRN